MQRATQGGAPPSPAPTYRILSAAHVLLAEIAPGRNRSARAREVTLVVLPDVEVRRSAGGDLLLFRPGEPRGRTAPEAVECGWAQRTRAPRKERAPSPLTSEQVQSLHRAFDHCGGRTRDRRGGS